MSPIGIGSAVIALFLGSSGLRLWWKGLAIIAALAALFTAIGLAMMRGSADPLALNVKLGIGATLGVFATLLVWMLLFYGLAVGVLLIYRHLIHR